MLTGLLNLVRGEKQTSHGHHQLPQAKKYPKSHHTSLIGDVGGTMIRLMIIDFTRDSESYKIVQEKTYDTSVQKFESMEHALRDFLSQTEKQNWPEMAHLGIAGVIQENKNLKMANRPDWPRIDGDELGKNLNIRFFKLYNDFEIASYSVLKLDKLNVTQINNAQGFENGPMVVCGVGTGLGLSFIAPVRWSDNRYKYFVFPTEAGHAGFPQATELEQEYYKFLKIKYPSKGDNIGLEYTFTGPCIPFMYEFLKKKYPQIRNSGGINIETDSGIDASKFQSYQDFPRREVFKAGVQQQDKLCEKVLELFLDIYQAVIGDIMVRYLPYGGIYLTGGITESVLEFFLKDKSKFMEKYRKNKEYLNAIFEKVPVFVIKGEAGLLGAFAVSQQFSQIMEKELALVSE